MARPRIAFAKGVAPIPELSFAAIEDGALVGTIQCWPVEIIGDDGDVRPLVLVGPVAVEPARQRGGLGKELMHQALDAAVELDLDGAMMLVGDPEYYSRFWGFSADATGGWRLPGPVERHRLLARGADVPAISRHARSARRGCGVTPASLAVRHADGAAARSRQPVARRHRAAGEREAPAAGRQMAPDALRRQRHADRARRHLVPHGLADRPAGNGAAVLDDPAARARWRLCAGHAGRKARHRGRGRAVRRGRDEGGGRRQRRQARLPAQHRRPRHRRRRIIRCASSRPRMAPAPISTSAADWRRWSCAASITISPNARCRATTIPPACGATARSFALEPAA